jgi:hypothetical protein
MARKKPPAPPVPYDEAAYAASVVGRSLAVAQALALAQTEKPARPRLVLPEGAIDVTAEMMGKAVSIVGAPVPKPADGEG